MKFEQIGLIDYGEVGRVFSAGIKAQAGISAVGSEWQIRRGLGCLQAYSKTRAGRTTRTNCRRARCYKNYSCFRTY